MVAVDGLDELAKSKMGTVEATKLKEYDDTLATFVAKCQPTAGDDPTFLNKVSREFDFTQPFDLKANRHAGDSTQYLPSSVYDLYAELCSIVGIQNELDRDDDEDSEGNNSSQ